MLYFARVSHLPEQFDRSRADRLDVDEIDDMAAEQRGFRYGHAVREHDVLTVFRGQRDPVGEMAGRRQTVSVFGAHQEQIRLAGFQEVLREVSGVQPPHQCRPSDAVAVGEHFHL